MINAENCASIYSNMLEFPSGDTAGQAAAWRVIAKMCFERGLTAWDESQSHMTGLQRVVNHLDKHLPAK